MNRGNVPDVAESTSPNDYMRPLLDNYGLFVRDTAASCTSTRIRASAALACAPPGLAFSLAESIAKLAEAEAGFVAAVGKL